MARTCMVVAARHAGCHGADVHVRYCGTCRLSWDTWAQDERVLIAASIYYNRARLRTSSSAAA